MLSISEKHLLFTFLGTTFGGVGTTTFALPNLCDRVPIGTGQGPGLSARSLGEQVGVEEESCTGPRG